MSLALFRRPLPPDAPDSGFGGAAHIWASWGWQRRLHLGESIETEPPHDAWAVLRRDQLWKRTMTEQAAQQAAARSRNIAALNAEAAAAAALSSLASSSLAAIPADVLHRPIMRLADIELQLVMTFLPYHDLLHFARLCQRTVRAASSALPWRTYVMPVLVDAPVAHVRGLNAHAGFLGHAPLSLQRRARPPPPLKGLPANDFLLAALDHLQQSSFVRPVHRLDLIYPHRSGRLSVLCGQILTHPALRFLRILRLGSGLWRVGYAAVLKAIAALPHLHSLMAAPDTHSSFHEVHNWHAFNPAIMDRSYDFDSTSEAAQAWSRLAAIPGLTALNIADSGTSASGSRLPHIYACSKLEKLGVVWPSLYGLSWTIFFSAPAIQNLQSLSLDFFDASSTRPGLTEALRIPEGAFAAGWAGMLRLRTLTLRHIRGIDQLLPSIAAAPALESVVLFPGVRCSPFNPLQQDTIPTPAILASLINSAPNLSVTMVVLTTLRKSAVQIAPVFGYESSILSLTLQRFKMRLTADAKSV